MRAITSSVLAEFAKQRVAPFVACQIQFSDQTLYIWTGVGTLKLPGLPMPLAIAATAEAFGGATVQITLVAEPFLPLAIGQNYKLDGLTYATWLNGLTLTVTSVATTKTFVASYTHSVYVRTFDTGTATITSDVDYIGVGNLAGIGVIQETTEVRANGIQLSLSGIPADMISEALSYCRQGLPVRLWLGVLNSSGGVIADPATAFVGRMDTVSIDEGADTATITISVEGRLIDLQRPRIRRYTDDDQQRTSPGDKGFQYVPMVQDWNGPWGLHDRGH